MKLIILSILFTLSQSNRLLQTLPDCSTIKCGSGGPCFDNPYTKTGTPRCCPADAICSSNDYQDTTMVICEDGNTYDNKCYGYCAGNKPKNCQPICKCNPGNNDCSYGYECLETPFGFAGCDEKTTDSCFGFCVSTGAEKRSCGGIVGISACTDNEQCFYTEIFSYGGGIGYCGSLPDQCKKPVGCNKDAKICPDGSTVGRIPPNCEFDSCPKPNYCSGYKNCKLFFDGCNECTCNLQINVCTDLACEPQILQTPYCMECIDGYELNAEYGQCELKTKPKPVCGGFTNCQVYHDGCNQCQCGPKGDACNKMACPPIDIRPEPKCIRCEDGYELNKNGKCKKLAEVPVDTCPVTQPMSGEKCNFKGSCNYGKEYCCGQEFDSYVCDCLYGNAICYYTDECLDAPEKCDKISTKTPIGLIGGNQDEHGCYTSAGYTWCQAKQKCLRIWKEPCVKINTKYPTLNICTGHGGYICPSSDICYDTSIGHVCCGPNECATGPTCNHTSEPCEPGYECVPDPTIPCTYGTDADCPGTCLWIKPLCNDLTCKGNDECFQFNNGPICCDPQICLSDQKCDGPNHTTCEEFGLFGYECVDNPSDPCDRNNDDCAGICVNPNATPEPETTTGIVNSICPLGWPNPGDKCDFEGFCFYGKESCCGQTFDSFGCKCENGQAVCFYTDACLGAPVKCDVKGPVCGTDVKQCYDGTEVNRDPNNNCQFPKCPKPKPVCGGFKNCQAYNDGCNYCTCGENGKDMCQSKYCPPELQNEKAKCTGCKSGYELNDYSGKCVQKLIIPPQIPPQLPEMPPQSPEIPPQIPVVKPCCNSMDRPIGCIEGSACCPGGTWTCGIGNGGFSCGGKTLFPNQDNFGKICDTDNTLPPGCAYTTCAIDRYCCDDGFGGATCCSKDIPNYSKVSCDKYSDCDRDNGYQCYPDPLCKGNGGNYLSCSEQKVCLSSGGKCDSDLDCGMDYKCISVTKTVGFCVKYQ